MICLQCTVRTNCVYITCLCTECPSFFFACFLSTPIFIYNVSITIPIVVTPKSCFFTHYTEDRILTFQRQLKVDHDTTSTNHNIVLSPSSPPCNNISYGGKPVEKATNNEAYITCVLLCNTTFIISEV